MPTRHPLGYGKENFFWAFVASMFTSSRARAFNHAGRQLDHPGRAGLRGVLSGSGALLHHRGRFTAERIKQVHGKAERWRVRPVSYLRQTSDTSVRAVVFEDVSALIGWSWRPWASP